MMDIEDDNQIRRREMREKAAAKVASDYQRRIEYPTERWTHGRIKQELRLKDERIEKLKRALEDSVRLQAHYAELLNGWDGGKRIVFKSVEEWLKRLDLVCPSNRPRRREQE